MNSVRERSQSRGCPAGPESTSYKACKMPSSVETSDSISGFIVAIVMYCRREHIFPQALDPTYRRCFCTFSTWMPRNVWHRRSAGEEAPQGRMRIAQHEMPA